MDRFRQKTKKEKPTSNKGVDRDKPPLFITDVKAIKENIKIKEILRTVKMNSSMRIKAPRGSKVMQNKDFNDNEDIFDDTESIQDLDILEVPSATNPDVVINTDCINIDGEIPENLLKTEQLSTKESSASDSSISQDIDIKTPSSDTEAPSEPPINGENKQDILRSPDIKIDLAPLNEHVQVKPRERKLSLDQTMLTRREGLSQSELDLNSLGKSPLERKSSFFRKKMDSFLKNTTEIFKRQSISKGQSPMQRRGSMSMSLQSLSEKSSNIDFDAELLQKHEEEFQGSATSLQSSNTAGRSTSSLSQSDRGNLEVASEGTSLAGSQPVLVGSQPALVASQPLGHSNSINSLNEAYIQESLLNSRAISMSSGLDSAHGQNRRKANRSNRVTWLASEGLTNYLRRVIQDEKSREMQMCHSFQDFSTIPENMYSSKTDSKGRRLSYQRAVSGEDPVTRYQDSSLRRKQIPENSEANYELSRLLSEYTRNGVPSLKGYCIANIPDSALAYLQWAGKTSNIEEFFDWKMILPPDLPTTEEARQTVIRELVTTEADYIRHLMSIVEVFIATAHALQDAGKLLNIDTERLFTNIPDVLNASLYFWEYTIYPMLMDAVEKKGPFNTELMSSGFCRFRELFEPYEKYVSEQTSALDYLRSLAADPEFMIYLTWCHAQRTCNRLQLSDIMVKPMQRLVKYSLILRRIIAYTDVEPERTSLIAMETFAKNYVLDLNRSIRQKEELEKLDQLANSIESYEIDFKDEDIDRCFRMYSMLNLKAPMVNCLPNHSRSIIYEGDLRFKDNMKEVEVRVYLLTDMLLICKKMSKGSLYPYKLIRPKYMVDKLVTFPKYSSRNSKEIQSLIFVVADEVGSSCHAFALSETSKDSTGSLKLWEQKMREAKLTYELGVWFAKNPSRDISEVEMDSSSDYNVSGTSPAKATMKQSSEDLHIEREARERVAAMLHRSMGASTEYDFSQASMNTDSFDGEPSGASSRPPTLQSLRYPMKRASTGGSSRNSRLSSFQQSTSAASHDEPQPGPSRCNYKAGSSVEHVIPPQNPEDDNFPAGGDVVKRRKPKKIFHTIGKSVSRVLRNSRMLPKLAVRSLPATSITVNVVSESESETMVQTQQQPPLVVLQQSSPNKSPMPSRSSSTNRNTLRVQPQNVVMALVHSLPDLSIDAPQPPRPQQSPSPQSASEKLYQSHQELLQRNRLLASQHQYLSPDHRGTSYPPPSPTRASLKRGLAFSYSFKNPPLSKMGHVNSQSQLQAEAGPSTSQVAKGEKGSVSPVPSTATDKGDKKSKHVASKNKSGSSASPARKDDKGD